MHPIRSVRSVFIISLRALTLAACAGKVPPPSISYDDGGFRQATIIPDPPKPVRIVTVPQPLPLPGQLMPPPSVSHSSDKLPPTQRVAAANRAALQEPTAHGYVNAIQVYPLPRARSTGSMPRLSR